MIKKGYKAADLISISQAISFDPGFKTCKMLTKNQNDIRNKRLEFSAFQSSFGTLTNAAIQVNSIRPSISVPYGIPPISLAGIPNRKQ
ncbi:hypothetical protein HDC92_000048 [Pedobacter sp. AK017]|uniref:hypothetical protein n=1 Tax=Pedobacter sp. AK017 TaxID=2723073 RepID=UPI0017E938DF|nr:hypothetical protein [Pedobacter sp. AK017]MBB5436384.1 hypothetical protein [Pedobacter sp. AK017]